MPPKLYAALILFFSPGATSTSKSRGTERSLMSPVLGSTLTSMIVSVRLPPSSLSGRLSEPSTSTLKGLSTTFPSPPNILWTQLARGASSRSGPRALSPAGSYASATPPANSARKTAGKVHIHHRRRAATGSFV